jgi:hypothetical protein
MQNRRDFLKTAAFAAIGSGLSLQGAFAGEKAPVSFAINQLGLGAKMKLRFFPYELKLKHVFTVATYSRTTTPDVQVEIEYDGVIGYGEASMPPYLGQTVDSVMGFLKKVDLEQFDDPFRLEDILAYVDGLTPGDTAAKAAIDIALHDLVGKLWGAPWYRIWGLDKAKAPSTTFTIGIDTPEVVREKTLEVAGQFNILKVKLGRENDKQMIETIRSVSDLPIAVDANQGWTDKNCAAAETAHEVSVIQPTITFIPNARANVTIFQASRIPVHFISLIFIPVKAPFSPATSLNRCKDSSAKTGNGLCWVTHAISSNCVLGMGCSIITIPFSFSHLFAHHHSRCAGRDRV